MKTSKNRKNNFTKRKRMIKGTKRSKTALKKFRKTKKGGYDETNTKIIDAIKNLIRSEYEKDQCNINCIVDTITPPSSSGQEITICKRDANEQSFVSKVHNEDIWSKIKKLRGQVYDLTIYRQKRKRNNPNEYKGLNMIKIQSPAMNVLIQTIIQTIIQKLSEHHLKNQKCKDIHIENPTLICTKPEERTQTGINIYPLKLLKGEKYELKINNENQEKPILSLEDFIKYMNNKIIADENTNIENVRSVLIEIMKKMIEILDFLWNSIQFHHCDPKAAQIFLDGNLILNNNEVDANNVKVIVGDLDKVTFTLDITVKSHMNQPTPFRVIIRDRVAQPLAYIGLGGISKAEKMRFENRQRKTNDFEAAAFISSVLLLVHPKIYTLLEEKLSSTEKQQLDSNGQEEANSDDEEANSDDEEETNEDTIPKAQPDAKIMNRLIKLRERISIGDMRKIWMNIYKNDHERETYKADAKEKADAAFKSLKSHKNAVKCVNDDENDKYGTDNDAASALSSDVILNINSEGGSTFDVSNKIVDKC